MLDIEGFHDSFTRPERLALQRHLLKNRARIIDAWTTTQFNRARLTSWRIVGVDGQDCLAFQRTFLGPLLDLLTGWLATGEAAWRALYRDERLRYAPHQASPGDRARFFGEILPDDEQAIVASVPVKLRERLAAALTGVHVRS